MSNRPLTTATAAVLASSQVRAVAFVEMDFPSGFLRMNNSAQSMDWNGLTWLGVGRVGSIDVISEGLTLEARGLRFSIAGVDPGHIAVALGQQYQGRTCKVWFAALNEDYSVVADPYLVFSGRMDTMDVELGTTASITVSAESRLADWDRPRVRRYNAADQAITDPSDKGFEFIPQMVEKNIRWGY
jgi:hypothetical protein